MKEELRQLLNFLTLLSQSRLIVGCGSDGLELEARLYTEPLPHSARYK